MRPSAEALQADLGEGCLLEHLLIRQRDRLPILVKAARMVVMAARLAKRTAGAIQHVVVGGEDVDKLDLVARPRQAKTTADPA